MKRRALVLAVVALAALVLSSLGTAASAAPGGQGAPSISVTKSCSPSSFGSSGGTVNFTVTVTNTGKGTVFVQSVSDPGVSLSGPSLPTKLANGKKSASATWTGSKAVTSSGSNTASVTATRGKAGNGPATSDSGSCSWSVAGAPLAPTGFNPVPFAAAAVLLLGLGGTFLLVTRRRLI
jgi:hypothetical protein